MANFNKCIPYILQSEGGLSDHPNDAGGITNYGISLRFAQDTGNMELFDVDDDGDIDREDIKKLSVEDAKKAYKNYFWDKFCLDDEPSDKVALVIFDIAVNHGIKNASNMIQKALVEIGFKIDIDGIVGPKTRAALAAVDPNEFVSTILCIRERFYYRIVQRNPSQKVFLKGWLNRIKNLRLIVEKDFS